MHTLPAKEHTMLVRELRAALSELADADKGVAA
jgi:hypothetical protein